MTYPATLPTPQTSAVTPAERRALATADRPREARPVQLDRRSFERITWPPMRAEQYAELRRWWRDDLSEGAAWFDAVWPIPQGWVRAVRKLREQPQWQFVPGGFWRISALCEIRGAGVVPVAQPGDEVMLASRTGPFSYIEVPYTDATHYESPSYDVSGWSVGNGTFGSGPHPSVDPGWPNPSTLVTGGDLVWLRKTFVVPRSGVVQLDFKADDTGLAYWNGELIGNLSTPSFWVRQTTFYTLAGTVVLAFRVRDNLPPGSGNAAYAGIEAKLLARP